jgi:hypothetical protein
LQRHQPVAHRSGAVIELARRLREDAPAGQRLRGVPRQPALEQRPQSGLAARFGERGADDLIDELRRRVLQDLDLQGLLRPEMREQPALGKAQFVGEVADGQAGETELTGEARGALEDGRPGALTFGERGS